MNLMCKITFESKMSKMHFPQNFFDLEEKVFHECGVCTEPVISLNFWQIFDDSFLLQETYLLSP